MKVCNKCHIEKPLTEFSKRQYQCKLCQKEHFKQYYQNNKDKVNQTMNKWRQNNRDKYNAYINEWQHNNKEQYTQILNKYYNKIPPSVYKITNEVNGRQYVGKTETPNRRKHQHLCYQTNANNSNELLQADIKQYGKHNFKFEIIEHCEVDKLLEREQYWIDTLQPYYNIQSKTHLETLKTTN